MIKPSILFVAVAIVSLVVISGCTGKRPSDEKKVEVTGAEPSDAPGEKAKAAPPETKKPMAADMLLGSWEVVKAEGQHADANKGLVYEFKPDGVALVHGWELIPNARQGKKGPDGGPIPKTYEWTWERIDSSKIELRHEQPYALAVITIKSDGDMIRFIWNQGGQIFTMKKK